MDSPYQDGPWGEPDGAEPDGPPSDDERPKIGQRTPLAQSFAHELEGWMTLNRRQRAYLAALIETGGNKGRAAAAVGVNPTTPWRWKTGYQSPHDPDKYYDPKPAYLTALGIAEQLAGDVLEDEARRRAVEGVTRYKVYQGEPVPHPDMCECDHHRTRHARARRGQETRPCADCTCQDFHGVPLVEHDYSDKLLLALLAAENPEKWSRKVQSTVVLRNINWDALPDAVVARLAAGEHPMSVFASAAEDGHGKLLASGAELHGPGADDEGSESEGAGEREAREREADDDS